MEKQHEHKKPFASISALYNFADTFTDCREASCFRPDALCVSTKSGEVMVSIQSLLAGFMVGFGCVGMIYFTHIGDPITHRPAFHILFAIAGCLLFLGQRQREAKL